MPKIKNWSKVDNPGMGISGYWKHEEKPIAVTFRKKPTPRNNKYTAFYGTPGKADNTTIYSGDDKEKVRKRAVKWMRNHPNG